jgi:hypothetical protein
MKTKNQIVFISSILALLSAAATIAAIYNIQTAKAQGQSTTAFGQAVIKPSAQCTPGLSDCTKNAGQSTQSGNYGGDVSTGARYPTDAAHPHNGVADFRANGCKGTLEGQTGTNPGVECAPTG